MKLSFPFSRIALAAFALFVCAASVQGQATGTVAIGGTVSPFVKLTSGGAATLTGSIGGGVTTQSASDAALATVVNFGEVGPGNANTYVCFTQPLFLRSNATASVRVAVTAGVFGPGASVQKSDIGIGVRNLSASGVNADVTNTTIVAAFAADPCAAPVAPTGIPTFSATLNSLATVAPGTTLISTTSPWSLRGSQNAASNRARVDLKLAIVPQAFTVGTFSATVTLTITSP